jgi:hypothetical protein
VTYTGWKRSSGSSVTTSEILNVRYLATIGISFGLLAVTLSLCYFIRYTQIGNLTEEARGALEMVAVVLFWDAIRAMIQWVTKKEDL